MEGHRPLLRSDGIGEASLPKPHPSRLSVFPTGSLAEALFHEAGDALLVIDPVTERVLDANPLARRLSELPPEELVGVSIRSLLRHSDRMALGRLPSPNPTLQDSQQWQDWLTPVHLTAPGSGGEESAPPPGHDGFLLRTRQPGRWVPVRVSIARLHPALEGHRDQSGGTGGLTPRRSLDRPLVLFALRDLREQVEADRRLRRAEGELHRVVLSVNDCLWSCHIDSQGQRRYRYLSPGVERITGRSARVFLDDPDAWRQQVEADDLPRWLTFTQRLAAGLSGELQYRLRRPDGMCAIVRERVIAAPDDEGLLLHGVLTDISERRVAPAEPPTPLARLDSLAGLAGSLAHDFNNLITGILGHASLARLPGGGADGALSEIEAIALRAAELCRQLAMFAGKGKGGNMPHHLDALVRETAAGLEPALATHQALRLDLAESLPPVLGDPTQLRTVVTNLFANAFEALGGTPGEVVLRTTTAEAWWRGQSARPGDDTAASPALRFHFSEAGAPISSAGCTPARPFVCLEVRDNGPGIPSDVQARIFEPFFSTRPGSRGLGLSAVFGIVRAHRGAIEVESTPGQGTAVRILLPAAPELPGVSVQPVGIPANAHPPGCSATVLLADDEDIVLDVAHRLLISMGCEVIRASDGEEAVELFRRHAHLVRIAFLDLTMPRLSGDQAARELQRLAPGLPIVLMSGYPESDVAASLGDLRLAGYLQKPFRLPSLASLLEQLLAR